MRLVVRLMDKLHTLDAVETRSGRKQPASTFFNRRELQQLLNLYSRRVASGEWRDYAIDQVGNAAVFSVFRHTMETPLFSITKRGQGSEYVVHSGPRRLKRASTLSEALSVLERRRGLWVVS